MTYLNKGMEMKNIMIIIFDFFGVCVNNFPQQTGEALLDKFSINKAEWNVFAKNAADGLDTGEKEEEQFVEDIVRFFGLQCSPEELAKDIRDWDNQFLRVNNGLIDIIKKLRGKYVIVCFSDVSKALSARMNKLGLYDIFDQTFFSYKIGKTKSDAAAWEHIEKTLGLKLQECLFIDDSEQNIKIAKERGWQAIQFENNCGVEERLRGLL